jgi:hypothetical protein
MRSAALLVHHTQPSYEPNKQQMRYGNAFVSPQKNRLTELQLSA